MNKEDKLETIIRAIRNLKKQMHIYMCENNSNYFSKELALHVMIKRARNGVISLSELRPHMHLAPSTITSILTYLEDNGFIERIIDKADRRNICIKITKKGYLHMEQNRKVLNQEFDKYVNFIGDQDIDKLIDILGKTTVFLGKGEEYKNGK